MILGVGRPPIFLIYHSLQQDIVRHYFTAAGEKKKFPIIYIDKYLRCQVVSQ